MITSRTQQDPLAPAGIAQRIRASYGQVASQAFRPTPLPLQTHRPEASRRSGRGLSLWTGILLFLAALPAWAEQTPLPSDVPNIFDSEVRAHFEAAGMVNLGGNPDFPALLLEDASNERPTALLLGLDARNEKDTWSLTEDPIILIVVLSEPTKIKTLYMDAGFVKDGKPSGEFTEVRETDSANLSDLFKGMRKSVSLTEI